MLYVWWVSGEREFRNEVGDRVLAREVPSSSSASPWKGKFTLANSDSQNHRFQGKEVKTLTSRTPEARSTYGKGMIEIITSQIRIPINLHILRHESQDDNGIPEYKQCYKLRCSFYGLRSENPNQHLKDFLKSVDSLDLNVENRIEKGDPSNSKIPCMIGHKFIVTAYIDLGLPMSVMPLAYYNAIRNDGYENRGQNFIGCIRRGKIGKKVENVAVKVNFKDKNFVVGTLQSEYAPQIMFDLVFEQDLELSEKDNIFSSTKVDRWLVLEREHGLITFMDGIKEVTFKTPYRDSKMDALTSDGHDLLSSRVLLSEDDYRRGCERPFDLESRFYKDTDKLGPSYKKEVERIDIDVSFET
ncbi:hypothetical protein Tco_0719914 [Tanacetum coccineum]